MVQFLDNTIYTNHALRKICENLAGDYENFNFLKVKIGSGDNTLSQDRTEMSSSLYTLRIGEVSYKDGILTIICELPPELADVPITEIGLFDTVLGVDYLFSYSKVELTKPADLGYELTIVLNLGPKTIDFPGVNVFVVNEVEYATRETLDKFADMFIYVDTNLERVIASNAKQIGYNMAEVGYERQVKINDILRDSTYSTLYYSLLGRYGNQISDLYFIHEPNFLSYDIINFASEDSYLETYLHLYESYRDNITFHKGPFSLLWTMEIDDANVESTIFNKKSEANLYFSVDTQQNYEVFRIEKETPEAESIYHQALYNELVITLYGVSETYVIKYILDMADSGRYIGQQTPYILSFNGDFDAPAFQFFVDGFEPEEVDEPDATEPIEKALAKSKARIRSIPRR